MKSQGFTKDTVSFVLGAFFLFWMQSVIASGQLSSMRIGQAVDKTRVVFDLKQPQTYQISRLNNPSRLVVDFFNTNNGLTFKNKHITDSRLFKIRVSDAKKRVRVVLDLHKTPEYKTFVLGQGSKINQRLVVDLMDKKAVDNNQSITKSIKAKKAEKVNIAKKSVIKQVKKVVKKSVSKPDLAKQKFQASRSISNEKTKQSSKRLAKTQSKPVKNPTSVAVAQNTTVKTKTTKPAKAVAKKVSKPKSSVNQSKSKEGSTLLVTSSNGNPLVEMKKVKTAHKSVVKTSTQEMLNKGSDIFTQTHDFVIAIDAGHGGKDTGAIGHNHIYEKVATLNMAKELKKVIDRQPGMHAVLTRDKDVFIPLSKRVEIAKQKNADLFISIHADAFHDHSVRGGSVYVLSERGASSTMAKLLAKSENAALQEVSLNGLDDDVAFALSDLSRDATVKESRKLASTVLSEMRKKVKMHKKSVQSAGFAVLKSIDMPSLLIETAFISNPHEARNLMNKSFQKKMAGAIVEGLAQYAKQKVKKPRWGDTLYVHYKVQRGDTLSQIAANYQVTTLALKKLNNIKNANSLFVGKKLKIPVSEKYLATLG
ncbi:MAG TPA: AMIN domain-containing protein [Thiomicrospira sp.]|jgi:N-acetylmuramoyl-L-alanine amidase|nr:AMIN domain-containing protein [Thiomicrospira sp.]